MIGKYAVIFDKSLNPTILENLQLKLKQEFIDDFVKYEKVNRTTYHAKITEAKADYLSIQKGIKKVVVLEKEIKEERHHMYSYGSQHIFN